MCAITTCTKRYFLLHYYRTSSLLTSRLHLGAGNRARYDEMVYVDDTIIYCLIYQNITAIANNTELDYYIKLFCMCLSLKFLQ